MITAIILFGRTGYFVGCFGGGECHIEIYLRSIRDYQRFFLGSYAFLFGLRTLSGLIIFAALAAALILSVHYSYDKGKGMGAGI